MPSPKQKNTKKIKQWLLIPSWKFVLPLVLIAVVVAYLFAQFRPTVETRRSTMKRIPSEVKKNFLTASPSGEVRVPILLYHYVEYVQDKRDTIRQSLDIIPSVFEQQVKTLIDDGYTFMTASDLADVLDGKRTLPAKPILLTFDDGHRDFATDVMPILEKYHVKVTQYVISSFLGGSDFMTSDQLRAVIDSHLVEIGGHTVHHIALAHKLLPVVQLEVNKNKADLEKDYGINVVSFAYPNGEFDEQAINVVKSAGYRTAVSTIPGSVQSQENRYFLYRLRAGYKVGPELLDFLQKGMYGAVGNSRK